MPFESRRTISLLLSNIFSLPSLHAKTSFLTMLSISMTLINLLLSAACQQQNAANHEQKKQPKRTRIHNVPLRIFTAYFYYYSMKTDMLQAWTEEETVISGYFALFRPWKLTISQHPDIIINCDSIIISAYKR